MKISQFRISLFLAVFLILGTGCQSFRSAFVPKPTPKPFLSDEEAVKEFNYALQLFEMRHDPASRVAEATDFSNGKNLFILGPKRVNLSKPHDLIWDVFHDKGTDVDVVPNGIDHRLITIALESERTRITLPASAFNKIAATDDIRFLLQTKKAKKAFAELVIPLDPDSIVEENVVIEGPDRVFPATTGNYSWTVLHPGQPVFVTADVPKAVSVKGQKRAAATSITVPRDSLNEIKSFHVKVFADGADLKYATPLAEKEISIGKPGVLGGLRASYQIEDQLDAEKHFGETFAKCFFCVKVTMFNDFDKPVTVDSSGIWLGVRYVLRMKKGQNQDSLSPFIPSWYANQNEEIIHHKGDDFLIWYKDRKPMNFTDVLNAIEFDQRHDPKSVFIKILRSAGVVASAAGVFTTGQDYAKVVSFIQGPITEQLAQFLLNDLVGHLSFLNENALHDSVSIEPLKSVSKFVFFPRGDIPGIWGLEMPVRIMTVEQAQKAIDAIVQIEQEKVKTTTEAEE